MDLKYNENGLIPVIAQDFKTKEVLMLAYMNNESYNLTINSGKVHYFSRSRNKIWLKGEESGNFQILKKFMYDCDKDTLLVIVEQLGVACHTGNKTCFFKEIEFAGQESIEDIEKDNLIRLYKTIMTRKENPSESSYTNYLFTKGIDKILKKIGEESAEVIIAAKNIDRNETIYEISDLVYHLSVLMAEKGIVWEDIYKELKNREK